MTGQPVSRRQQWLTSLLWLAANDDTWAGTSDWSGRVTHALQFQGRAVPRVTAAEFETIADLTIRELFTPKAPATAMPDTEER